MSNVTPIETLSVIQFHHSTIPESKAVRSTETQSHILPAKSATNHSSLLSGEFPSLGLNT
ncbi:hypothetical protein IFM47457_06792 [Aspergillus lentulus]|nr:hypothetical protein IFM47457_06792 [Aspergillus lentulus]